MASLTIRKLDDAIKSYLRLRSAKNGRSVEEEVRVILREYLEGSPLPSDAPPASAPPGAAAEAPATTPQALRAPGEARITLIIGGGIAAYKSLDLIRRLKERRIHVRCVLTKAAQQFVTLLAASALSGARSYTDLFDPDSEFDAGHIRLARDCDLIVVAPATADLMAKMAQGRADDLASAILLAATRPILLAPAMNPAMWSNAAARRNAEQLRRDGIHFVGPNAGEMAEAGEAGVGRMAEPTEIAAAADRFLRPPPQPLADRRVLITAGPTQEAIDPVRYISNRSSGKQGFAIAAAAKAAGADVTLITGPVELDDPKGVAVVHVESARQMLEKVEAMLPADIAIFAAAVADWRVAHEGGQKLKKTAGQLPPPLQLVENPDILATISKLKEKRPGLVIGFAAETEHLIDNAKAKLKRKGCDWILANDVSPATGTFGGDRNTIHLLRREGDEISVDDWPVMTKDEVAVALIAQIAELLRTPT
jgi:phosphopantothenoylcysteine decarboxylase / phosphopantothenate---cysteine ligase